MFSALDKIILAHFDAKCKNNLVFLPYSKTVQPTPLKQATDHLQSRLSAVKYRHAPLCVTCRFVRGYPKMLCIYPLPGVIVAVKKGGVNE